MTLEDGTWLLIVAIVAALFVVWRTGSGGED